MKKLFGALVSISMLGVAATAFAGERVQLTEQQMDSVTAGAASGALINLSALATGTGMALTDTAALATIIQTPVPIVTPLGTVTLLNGGVFAIAASTSAN